MNERIGTHWDAHGIVYGCEAIHPECAVAKVVTLRSALDAMTAERDALIHDNARLMESLNGEVNAAKEVEAERDSAREALAKACRWMRSLHPAHLHSINCALCKFLAAQPETKT